MDELVHGPLPPFIQWETRPGLALADKQTRDGLLYTRQNLRFEPNCGFLGEAQLTDGTAFGRKPLSSGRGIAGGKGRPVAFEAIDLLESDWYYLQNQVAPVDILLAGGSKGKKGDKNAKESQPSPRYLLDLTKDFDPARKKSFFCWLTLISPCRQSDKNSYLDDTAGIEIKAAVLGKPMVISGFSLVKGRGRPPAAYLPGGSCWLLEVEAESREQLLERLSTLHNRHSLGPQEERPFGFGRTLILPDRGLNQDGDMQ